MAATVAFPFAVKTNDDGSTSLVETDFRFTIKTARELEKSAGQGIAYLVARGQSVESLVLLVCYGLRFARPKLREDDAVQLIQDFLDAGGDVNKLSEALVKCLNESGVYGQMPKTDKPKVDLLDGDDPLAQAPKTTSDP
jgi:hypothetical protein